MLQSLYSLAATGSFCWFLASSLWIYPHSLSYFNESVGGPLNGPQHLLGSCVDWGQDLKYLRNWLNDMSNNRHVHLGLYSLVDPGLLGFADVSPISYDKREIFKPQGDKGPLFQRSDAEDRNELKVDKPSTYIIGANLLFGFPWKASDGLKQSTEISEAARLHFKSEKLIGRCGYSVLIFRF